MIDSQMISDIAKKVATAHEKEITSQLNELISRNLLVVETLGPTLVQDQFGPNPYEVTVKTAVRLKLKDQEYIEQLEKENNIDVFEVIEILDRNPSYVVRKDGLFSHGETVEKAIDDLRYKIGDRDTSLFEHWKTNPDLSISAEEAIKAYRIITGACELGVKEFVESISVPELITPNVILAITSGKYGHDKFREFLGVNNEN